MLIDKLGSRGLAGRVRKRSDRGFTLVELLVVITILGILAAVVIAAVSGIGDKGEESAKKTDVSILRTAQEIACTNQDKRAYDDVPQLRRDGFLASASGYNDIDLNPVNQAPEAQCTDSRVGVTSRYAVWSPTKTQYPVTITGCNGVRSTFDRAPTRIGWFEPQSFTVLLALGLEDIAVTGGQQRPGGELTVPVQYRKAYLDRVGTTAQPGPAILPNAASGRRAFVSDTPILRAGGVDLVYSIFNVPNFLPKVDEEAFQATFKTYAGFSGDPAGCVGGNGTDVNGNPLPFLTLEALYDDIRNLGVIFDVQERAMKLIEDMKTRMGDALLKGKAATNGSTPKVGIIDTFYLLQQTGGFSDPNPLEHTGLFFGNTPANAAVRSAGGVNVLEEFTLTPEYAGAAATAPGVDAPPKSELIARMVAAAPEALVFIYEPSADAAAGQAQCASALHKLREQPNGENIPALRDLAKTRFLCLSYYDFAANKPWTITGILALAALLADPTGGVPAPTKP